MIYWKKENRKFSKERKYIMKKKISMKNILVIFFLFVVVFTITIPTVPVKAEEYGQTFQSGRRKYYLTDNDTGEVKLYEEKGSDNILVAQMQINDYDKEKSGGYTEYVFTYNHKLYFTYYPQGGTTMTFSYKIGGDHFELDQYGMGVINHKNQYAIGYTSYATDVSSMGLGLYNLKTKKVKKLGNGYTVKLISGKVYYDSMSSNYKKFKVIRCNLDGSRKKVLKTVTNKKEMVGVQVYKHYATYCVMIENGRSVSKKVRY